MTVNLLKGNTVDQKNTYPFAAKLFLCFVVIIFLSWICIITGIISLSWFFSYEEIVTWKAEKTLYFQENLSVHNIPLQYENYRLARGISVLLGGGVVSIVFLLFVKRKKIYLGLQQIISFLIEQWLNSKRAFSKLKTVEKLAFAILFIISIGLRIYHFSYLPIHVDELMTYYFFVKECFLLTSLYYPIPNNHVFFNFIFIVSNHLIDDPILAGRAPSALAYHLILLLLFSGLLRYFKSFRIAFLSTTICVFFFPSSVYAAEARGYAVLSLMLMLAAFSLLLITEKKRKEAIFIFIPACVIGAWIVPVFFIPFLSMMCFWLWVSIMTRSSQLFKWMVLCGVGVGIGVGISYLPMFLFSGVESITANDYVVPVQTANFFTYIYPVASAEIISFFAGTDTKGWVIFLIFGLVVLVVYWKADDRYRRWIELSSVMLGMIFLYALLSRRFMSPRTITYATYFLYPSAAIILVYVAQTIIKTKLGEEAVLGLIMLSIPFLSYLQYQENVFEAHLLPSAYYNVIEHHFNHAIENRNRVYLAVSDEYIYIILYGRYLAETRNMKLVNDMDDASILIIEETMINEFSSDELSSFENTGISPALSSFLNTLFFYNRN